MKKRSASLKYAVVIERAKGNFSGYVPDLPGCVATGRTRAATLKRLGEAIELHLAGLREDRLPVPLPTAVADYIEAAA